MAISDLGEWRDPTDGRRRRRLWSIVDQGLSSLSNMAVSVAVARAVGVKAFGGFSVAYVAYTVLLGLTRALVAEPLTVRHSAADPAMVRQAIADATGAAFVVGLLSAVPLAGVASFCPPGVKEPLLALALFLPGLMVQDAWRFAFIAKGEPRSSAVNDLLWLGLQLLLFVVVARVAEPSGGVYLAAWGLAATIAALLASIQSGVAPAPGHTISWLRSHGPLVRAFTFEFAARTGARQMTLSIVGVTAGLAAIGALRAGQVVFGPLNVILLGASMAAVPEAVRSVRSRSAGLVAFCDRLVLGLGTLCVGYTAVAMLVPDRAGQAALGAAWSGAGRLFPSQGALLASIAACSGYLVGLRALEALRSSVVARAVLIPATVIGGAGGALVDGARGLLLGLTAANALGAALLRRSLVRAALPGRSGATAAAPEDPAAPTPPPPSLDP